MSWDMDRERQFDDILDAADGDIDAIRDAARRLAHRDSILSESLELAATLRSIKPSQDEVTNMRLRVGQRLSSAILAGQGEEAARVSTHRPLRLSGELEYVAPANESVTGANGESAQREASPPAVARITPPIMAPTRSVASDALPQAPRRVSSQRRWFTYGTLAAAILLLLASGLAALSGPSLPGSPLYSFKRAEESALLALPLNNVTRAQALGFVAVRRLTEAQTESENGQEDMARKLVDEFNNDVHQMIIIAVAAQYDASASNAVTAQIASVLQTQDSMRRAAVTRGDTTFSQTLNSSKTTIETNLQQEHVSLPPVNDNATNQPGGTPGTSATPGSVVPTATATAMPTVSAPTATPCIPRGSGQNCGNGHGHGNGSGS